METFAITHNNITLRFEPMTVLRFKRKGKKYPCPLITEKNLNSIVQFYSEKVIAIIINEKLQIYYQDKYFNKAKENLEIFKKHIIPFQRFNIKNLQEELMEAIRVEDFERAKILRELILQKRG
jgi:hypothetical protein